MEDFPGSLPGGRAGKKIFWTVYPLSHLEARVNPAFVLWRSLVSMGSLPGHVYMGGGRAATGQ